MAPPSGNAAFESLEGSEGFVASRAEEQQGRQTSEGVATRRPFADRPQTARSESAAHNYLIRMVPPAGLEPATHELGIRRSIHLSYGGSSLAEHELFQQDSKRLGDRTSSFQKGSHGAEKLIRSIERKRAATRMKTTRSKASHFFPTALYPSTDSPVA